MSDLLLELFSEEIPARMQAGAARDLERLARERLGAAELAFDGLQAFAGPRRLTLTVAGLPAAQADRKEERRGPRTNAPEKALEGFLRSTGLRIEQLDVRDGAYVASIDRPGRPTAEIIAETVEAIVRGFPWPKSMRWGEGSLRWVRPLKRILCMLDAEVVALSIDGVESGNLTEGHRFLGTERGPFAVTGLEEYRDKLAARFVVLDAAERKRRILEGARAVCSERGLALVEDEGLLEEVAGLAEWPVPILGDMDAGFLDLPPEVIRTSMRVHQRYFAVRDPGTGKLAPHFVVVANIEPQDGGAMIAAGNARVLTARLSDARFFWNEDRREGAMDRWQEKLNGVTFHAKLGTMAERVARIEALAREIAPLVGADPKLAATAARLCKADLASGMVSEFPELQGIMGGYYVREASFPLDGGRAGMGVRGADLAGGRAGGETPIPDPSPMKGEGSARDQVADAVRDHYKPQGPSDTVPTALVTVAVALADKLDTLVGFFAIDERPTGSKDPYALRRAALGIVRLIFSTVVPLNLEPRLVSAILLHLKNRWARELSAANVRQTELEEAFALLPNGPTRADLGNFIANTRVDVESEARDPDGAVHSDALGLLSHLLSFFADRLKVLLRDEGKRHDLVDAVFALGDDDLVRIVRRVDALSGFLATDDGANLLAGYKRATNILRAEAKKTPGEDYQLNVDLGLIALPEEEQLAAALRGVEGEVDRALQAEDFEAAMRHLSHLRAPVDAFFDKVLVNDADPAVRLNRLRLLSDVRDTANRVADFSLVSNT